MADHTLARFPRLSRVVQALTPAFVVALVVASGACGGGEDAPAPPTDASAEPAADASAPASPASQAGRRSAVEPVKTTEVEPSGSDELGGLHGTILFAGTAPERFPLGAGEMSECQHHPEVDQRSNLVVVNDGKLANVLVTLKSGWDEARVPPPTAPAVTLDQRGCMYVPRVLGLQLGQELRVANSDPTNHNVHSHPRKNAGVNLSMGAKQPALALDFEHAEMVRFTCDIHPWMGAAVFVEEHPWFAVTDASGAFRIPGVPPGEYVVEARHEHKDIRAIAGKVTVKAGGSQGFTLTLTMSK
jgi:plastocyanin